MALCVIVKHKINSWFEAKMAGQLFNVANIKYRCLSNGGHSVRFLNRSGKFVQPSIRISEVFFFTWCSVDKFIPHIYALLFRSLTIHGNQKFCKIGQNKS